jgi:hypothetical protein
MENLPPLMFDVLAEGGFKTITAFAYFVADCPFSAVLFHIVRLFTMFA